MVCLPVFIYLSWTRLHLYVLTMCAAAANQMAQQMASMNPTAGMNPFQPGQDPDKLYLSEAENLEVMEHFCILDGIEDRILHNLASE